MFFFSCCRSGATCVYLIINACGLHFNSFKLIISESWIKDKGVKMLLYGLVCLYCVSPAQLNYVFAVVKHALKRRWSIIPLTHIKIWWLQKHSIPHYNLNLLNQLFPSCLGNCTCVGIKISWSAPVVGLIYQLYCGFALLMVHTVKQCLCSYRCVSSVPARSAPAQSWAMLDKWWFNRRNIQDVTCAVTKNMFGERSRAVFFPPPTPVIEQLESLRDKQYLCPWGAKAKEGHNKSAGSSYRQNSPESLKTVFVIRLNIDPC